jgi:hypothetical protein
VAVSQLKPCLEAGQVELNLGSLLWVESQLLWLCAVLFTASESRLRRKLKEGILENTLLFCYVGGRAREGSYDIGDIV